MLRRHKNIFYVMALTGLFLLTALLDIHCF